MGQSQSKDELVYQQVSYNNIEGIKALCREGAGLEWYDTEGKTPLIVACMNPDLYNAAKTLLELGAKVDAYRPGRHAGTALHHAAKRGLVKTVKLLLSHGANALMVNDDCQTPLNVARIKGFSNVVRAIERHICLFSGMLREFYGPGFIELLSQLMCRKIWAVVLPCGSRNLAKPLKLELAIYSTIQDAMPRTIVPLWKASMEDPKLHLNDPVVTIISTKARIKLASANENDKQQLEWFCNACKGIVQINSAVADFYRVARDSPEWCFNKILIVVKLPVTSHSTTSHIAHNPPVAAATAPQDAEDLELAMAINASVQSANKRPSYFNTHQSSVGGGSSSSTNGQSSSSSVPSPASPSNDSISRMEDQESGPNGKSTLLIPSAPLLVDEILAAGPVQYPSIDSAPVDMSATASTSEKKDGGDSSTCVICLDAPVEGACVPCGHMAGCMSCLNEIKGKNWGCPVCRANIDQVIRLYLV